MVLSIMVPHFNAIGSGGVPASPASPTSNYFHVFQYINSFRKLFLPQENVHLVLKHKLIDKQEMFSFTEVTTKIFNNFSGLFTDSVYNVQYIVLAF